MFDWEDKKNTILGNYADSNYQVINVKAGKCRYNFRCQFNAIHEAWRKGHKQIAMCVYFDDGKPIVHFINYDGKKFVDNTLGEWSRELEYHLVRFINESEFKSIHGIFSRFRSTIHRMMPWYIQWFTDKNY